MRLKIEDLENEIQENGYTITDCFASHIDCCCCNNNATKSLLGPDEGDEIYNICDECFEILSK